MWMDFLESPFQLDAGYFQGFQSFGLGLVGVALVFFIWWRIEIEIEIRMGSESLEDAERRNKFRFRRSSSSWTGKNGKDPQHGTTCPKERASDTSLTFSNGFWLLSYCVLGK
jgi:hypothetical protein